ncbi:hypothetical protein AWT69_002031 [Pseudomonas putida]|nr:hypothetical protein AWT69_002031 [Pseudomonas putida]
MERAFRFVRHLLLPFGSVQFRFPGVLVCLLPGLGTGAPASTPSAHQ